MKDLAFATLTSVRARGTQATQQPKCATTHACQSNG